MIWLAPDVLHFFPPTQCVVMNNNKKSLLHGLLKLYCMIKNAHLDFVFKIQCHLSVWERLIFQIRESVWREYFYILIGSFPRGAHVLAHVYSHTCWLAIITENAQAVGSLLAVNTPSLDQIVLGIHELQINTSDIVMLNWSLNNHCTFNPGLWAEGICKLHSRTCLSKN